MSTTEIKLPAIQKAGAEYAYNILNQQSIVVSPDS